MVPIGVEPVVKRAKRTAGRGAESRAEVYLEHDVVEKRSAIPVAATTLEPHESGVFLVIAIRADSVTPDPRR